MGSGRLWTRQSTCWKTVSHTQQYGAQSTRAGYEGERVATHGLMIEHEDSKLAHFTFFTFYDIITKLDYLDNVISVKHRAVENALGQILGQKYKFLRSL